MATALRFAILCRVSTEGQANEGESLVVQQKRLRECVQILNGTIVKEYSGSESATSGEKERPILDEMLADARLRAFDCLMVYDLSRLTRDPLRSKVILADLKKNGIRLFVQAQEHDLNSLETALYTGIIAEVNAFQVAIQVKKSIESKIELAKKGWLVVGRPPFGRKLEHNDRSKAPVWIIDEEKLEFAQRIYDLYINQNIYIDKIAKMLDMDASSLFRIVKDRAVLVQTFNWKGEKIEILTPVPPLFTKEQQDRIRARLKSNKRNNAKKHDYLLSGLVKCKKCGLMYIGITTNQGKNTYYRHSVHTVTSECVKHINKHALDKVVLNNISELVSNNELLMNTIRECNQHTIERKRTLEDALSLLTVRQEKLDKRKNRIIKLTVDGVLTDDDAALELPKTKKELDEVNTEILSKKTEIESLESTEIPEEVLERVQYTFDCLKGNYGKNISQWAFEVKRLLVEWFFGVDDKNGVWIKGSEGEVLYTVRSSLGTLAFGWLEDDDDAGVVGQNVMREKSEATLAQFSSIFKNLGLNSNQHSLTSWAGERF